MHLIQEQNQGFDLQNIRNQLGNDWSAMDDEIITQLSSDVALVSSVANYIVQSGGKRFTSITGIAIGSCLRLPRTAACAGCGNYRIYSHRNTAA